MQNWVGGAYLGFAEASRMSDAELLEYIQLNTSKSIQALVPDASTAVELQTKRKALKAKLSDTTKALQSAQYRTLRWRPCQTQCKARKL